MTHVTWKEHVRKAEQEHAAWAAQELEMAERSPVEIALEAASATGDENYIHAFCDALKDRIATRTQEVRELQKQLVAVQTDIMESQEQLTELEKHITPVTKIASPKASGKNRKTPPKTQKDLLAGLAETLKDHPELAAKLAAAMK